MEWINIWGLIFMIVIMIPNVVYSIKCKEGFETGVSIVKPSGPHILFSGIMSRSILLIVSAIIFALSHILISYKNTK